MIPVALVLVGTLAVLAVTLNHAHARLGLVEVALNEGLPPSYAPPHAMRDSAASPSQIAEKLGPGVHVFLSRSCHACQGLIDELAQANRAWGPELHLRYVDRPRPVAGAARDQQGAHLYENELDLAQLVGADPLPYAIAIGPHDLATRGTVPDISRLDAVARDAGIVPPSARLRP